MKTRYFIISLIFILAIFLAIIFLLFQLNRNELEQDSNAYKNVLNEIELGNNYISAFGISDDCFPYRYYHRGCYYERKEKFRHGMVVSQLMGYNLTYDERIKLCYAFSFNGSVAYCLSKIDYTSCIKFASEDVYLSRICKLKEGQTIPTEGMWGPESDGGSPIPTVYIVANQ